MTDTNLQNKARAVVLAALMVLSVMVGTIALSGGAAATVTTATVADGQTDVDASSQISISGSTDADGTVYAFIDSGSTDGEFDKDDSSGSLGTPDEEGSFEGQLSPPSESGEYEVHIIQKGSDGLVAGDSGTVVKTINFDGIAPVFGDEHTREVTTTTPTLTVPLTDANTSVNASTIEVDFTSNGGENYIHQVNAPSSSSDGISYDASAGEVTIDLSSDSLKALEHGSTYGVDVSAEDAVGNTNTTSFDVTVDTGAPTFTLGSPSDGETVGEPTQTIAVSVSDSNLNTSTPELTITGPNGYEVVNNSSHGVYTDGTFTVNPGTSEGVSELPNGTISVSVTASDEYGNSASDSWSFTVDNQQPIVDGVSVNESLYTDKNSVAQVTVDFNEPVDEGTVAATISDGSSTSPALTFDQGNDGDESKVYATYDLLAGSTSFDGVEDGSVEVLVTAGTDNNKNDANLDAGSNSTTFGIDTVEPDVSIDTSTEDGDGALPSTFDGGVVDISQYVSVSQANGNPVHIGWKEHDDDLTSANVTWFDNAASVDTRLITEGSIDIVAVAEDENGTVGDKAAPVTVDAVAPTVTADSDVLTGTEGGEEYDVADEVFVEDNGTDTVTKYGYTTISGDTTADSLSMDDFSFGDDPTITVDGDATYVFAAKLSNGEWDKTSAVEGEIFDNSDLSISAERFHKDTGEKDPGHLEITVESNHKLSELNLTVESDDSYFSQNSASLSIADFEQSAGDEYEYNYTVTYETPRDGNYDINIDDAESDSGLTVTGAGSVDDIATDSNKPDLVDADIVGTDKGHTQVNLTFDQPIQGLTASDIQYRNGDVGVLGITPTSTGSYSVTFDTEIQTGDGANLTIAEGNYVEKYTHTDPASENRDGDAMHVDSVELDLQQGANLVSIPVESGSVDLANVNLDHVNVIWAYDNGEWTSYDPDAKHGENDFSALKGGQGYVFMADHSTTVDVRGYTAPAPDDNSGATPSIPTMEGLEKGWNLVGHYQEGSQGVGQAMAAVDASNLVSGIPPLGQANDYSYNSVNTFVPGEAYWVYVDGADMYTAVDYANEDSDISPSINSASAGEANPDDDGDAVISSSEQITVTADVSGTSMVSVDASWLNEGPLQLTSDGDGFSKTFSVAGDFDGTKTLTIEAAYSDGTTTTKDVTVNVDTTASTISNFAVTKSGQTAEVSFDSSEQLSTISVSGTDDASGTTLSKSDFTETGDATNGYTYTATLSSGADGMFGATLDTAADAAGNDAATGQSGSVSIDTTVQVSSIEATASGSDITVTVTDDEELKASSISVANVDGQTASDFTENTNDGSSSTYTYEATISGVSDDSYTVDVTSVEDTSGNSYNPTEAAAAGVTVDTTAPSMTDATKSGTNPTTVTVTLSDSTSGLDSSTVESGDFDVTDSSGTSVVATDGVSISSLSDGDTTATVTITLDGDYSGTTVTAEIIGDISDMESNTVSSGSQTATSA